MTATIHAATTIGAITLSVGSLQRSLDYYQHTIGLALLHSDAASATLGVGTRPLLHVVEVRRARLVRRATGLYHFALRVPTRRDLARVLRHFTNRGYGIGGAADHLFSEALYLSDPDGHGIEIYCDRPRNTWYDAQGKLRGASDPLDLEGILRELDGDEVPWDGLPTGTDMGHIHLQVADLRRAEQFYLNVLGFEQMTRMSSASFISAGGYHHHIGMNTWAGVGVAVPPEGAARLLSYEVLLPDQDALSDVLDRLHAAGTPAIEEPHGWAVFDPSHNRVLLRHTRASVAHP